MSSLTVILFTISFIAGLLSVFIDSLSKDPIERAIFRSCMFLGTTMLFAALVIREGF